MSDLVEGWGGMDASLLLGSCRSDKLLAKLLQKVRLPGVPVCQASIDALVRVYRLVYVTVMMSF